ncbi:hypothetical protein N7451_005201 [Penicillium sp. IBT 35674x]|nr:hypothetical protein N7451_005201 [Penicillium sp. IBT 35674x]
MTGAFAWGVQISIYWIGGVNRPAAVPVLMYNNSFGIAMTGFIATIGVNIAYSGQGLGEGNTGCGTH